MALRGVMIATLALALAACGTAGSSAAFNGGLTVGGCDLPWESVEQVERCAAPDYDDVSESGNTFEIAVESEDPAVIAAALADAYLRHAGAAEEIVVWAYSSAEAAEAGGYDRGVVSDQGELGERLVFEVCTEWEELDGPRDRCTDRIEFTIEQ